MRDNINKPARLNKLQLSNTHHCAYYDVWKRVYSIRGRDICYWAIGNC